jgi:hypothetical protein
MAREGESGMIDLPVWFSYLLKGLSIFAMLAFPAIVLARAGKSPYFALLLMVPFINVAIVWGFAYAEWPKLDRKT